MIGQTISHYKILEKLGGGGMGVVYKAEDTKLKRLVALKFLPPELTRDEEAKERFVHEAQAASALDHPNICVIHEIDETEDGQIFICMAYYEGETLKKRIAKGEERREKGEVRAAPLAPRSSPFARADGLPVDSAIDLAIQIVQGLAKAHAHGITHRDIKPANVMITKEGVAKIVDFGLAKLAGQSMLTKEGATVGTAAYMSPEQARGEIVDHRADIWALGVVLYQMLTGQLPFKGEYESAVIYSILNVEPASILASRPETPEALQKMVQKSLAKTPDDRYQKTDELLADLRSLQKAQEGGISKTHVGVRRVLPQRNRAFLFGGLTAVVLLSIAAYLFFAREPETTERVPIAVVDFVNQTNEPELDGLSGMLITALEQSRRLAVFSRARMFDVLKQMGRQDMTFVDEATGREICKRANVSAMAIATIRKFDNLYTIDFRVIDPQTGDHLFSTKEEGEGQKRIPGMIDRLSEKTRLDLKEQENVVRLASRGVAEVTTTNLEAYHHFFLGEQLMNQVKFQQAQEEYRQAIALDSTFGLAYYRLAYAINWLMGSEVLAKEPLQKALALIDRIPEKEKYHVRALHARIEKGYAASIPILKEMEQLYPTEKEMLYLIGDWAYHARQYSMAAEYFKKILAIDPTHERTLQHLSWTYRDTEQYDKMREVTDRLVAVNKAEGYNALGQYHRNLGEYGAAVEYLEKALKIDSTDVDAIFHLIRTYWYSRQYQKAIEYANKRLSLHGAPVAYVDLAQTYLQMGDLTKALQVYQLGLQHFSSDQSLLAGVGHVYEFKREYDKAEAHFKAMTEKHQPDAVRREGFLVLARFYPYLGKYAEMMKMYDKRIALHWSDKDTNSAAWYTAEKAYWMFWGRGNKHEALAEIQKALRFSNITSENYYGNLAGLYAQIGDLEKAAQVRKRLSNPLWTLSVEATLHFAKGEWKQAISKNERMNNLLPTLQPFTSYHSAQCYFELGEFDKAVAEVGKAQGFYGWWHSFTYSKGFYLLGKIYEKKDDKKLAIENYNKFLDLWKDADADLPELIEAKARVARLRGA